MVGANDRLKGTVMWFDVVRGYGFISPEDGGDYLFVHQSSIKAVAYRSPAGGEAVEFVISIGDDGLRKAVSVTGPGGAYTSLRNWAGLPGDVLLMIFKKITSVDIIRSAQYVCRPWRRLSYEPELWRRIAVTMPDRRMDMSALESLAMVALDRSQRCVEDFHLQSLAVKNDVLISYMSHRTTKLRRLHLISIYNMSETALAQAIKKFPLLEELEISFCFFSSNFLEVIGPVCRHLKSFRFNVQPHKFPYDYDWISDDAEAFSIAKHMKQLQRLQLIGNLLTKNGLLVILNSCRNLQCLDIRVCYNVQFFNEKLKRKCAKIKKFRSPKDSTADFELNAFLSYLSIFNIDDGRYHEGFGY